MFIKPRVGLDMDSVICNIEDNMLSYVRENWDSEFDFEQFCEFDFSKNPNLSTEAARGLCEVATSSEFLDRATLYSGVNEAIKKLSKIAEIYIVTGRHKERSGLITSAWLKRFELPYKTLFFTDGGSKEPVVDALNIEYFVEDNPYEIQNLIGVCEVFCVDRPWNRHLEDKRVNRVKSLNEAIEHIINCIGGIDNE